DRFFVDMPPPATPDPRLLGDFFVHADVTLGALAEIYGLPVEETDKPRTLEDYFTARFGSAVHVGEMLPVGSIVLIAHKVADGHVTEVGLQLAAPEPVVVVPKSVRRRLRAAIRRLRARIKRLM